MFQLTIVAALVIGAWGLRTFVHPFPRKLGGLLLLAASYCAAWFLTGRHAWGVAAVAAWFFLPWLEILTRVRSMRLPLEKKLRGAFAPSADRFPQLDELTGEIEDAGYTRVEDASYTWDDSAQFMRLFYHAEKRSQAVISLLEQGGLALSWVSLTSRNDAGQSWTTWNFPFSSTMKLPPEARLNACDDAENFIDLSGVHEGFLESNGVTAATLSSLEPDSLSELIQKEMRRLIDHNLDAGVVTLSGEGTVRYSWRGCFYLWRQLVKDMVRFC